MGRMGHDSSRAALIYQHATADADRATADAVSDQVKAEQERARKRAKPAKGNDDDGAAGVLARTT